MSDIECVATAWRVWNHSDGWWYGPVHVQRDGNRTLCGILYELEWGFDIVLRNKLQIGCKRCLKSYAKKEPK